MGYRFYTFVFSLFFLSELPAYPQACTFTNANGYNQVNTGSCRQRMYAAGPKYGQNEYAQNRTRGYSNTYETVSPKETMPRTFALQAETAVFIKDRSNPSKYLLTLQNVNPDVIYYASRTVAGRTSLKAFLQDVNLSEKSKIISSFSSQIQQHSFEPSRSVTLTLKNLKWNGNEKTITLDALASQQDQFSEGTYLKPLFFIRLVVDQKE